MDQNSTNPIAGAPAPVGNQNNFNGATMPANNFGPAQQNPMSTMPQTNPATQAPGQFAPQPQQGQAGNFGMPMQNPAAVQAQPGLQQPIPNIGLVNMNPVAQKKEKQKVHFPLFSVIGLVFACSVAAFAIVAAVQNSMNYKSLEANRSFEIEQAVLMAKAEQQSEDEKTFIEEEKLPFSHFTGPSNLGQIEFDYPKNWNIYVASDGSNGSEYVAYFAPDHVESVDDESSRYALIFVIANKRYEDQKKVFDAKATASSWTSQIFTKEPNIEGIRYDGTLGTNKVGSLVLIKVGDMNKTAEFQTDATIYRSDFDKVIDSVKRKSD